MIILVRQAEERDLAALAALSLDWEAEDITRGFRAEGPEIFRARLGSFCLVAESDNQTVGYAVATLAVAGEEHASVIDPGTHYLNVTDLYVSRPYRSQGVGRMLMQRLHEAAETEGVSFSLLFSMTRDQERKSHACLRRTWIRALHGAHGPICKRNDR